MSIAAALGELEHRFSGVRRLLVAYSGGRDSHVLLHAAKRFSALPVRALHVDHGLQSAAQHWAAHCRSVCADLHISITVAQAQVLPSGSGVEAAAREARYAVFEAELGAHELLLLAHHADDQAETLMLRLLRGSGLRGLGAMPARRDLGLSQLCRPLLATPSAELKAYADQHALRWIDDPSNTDHRFDRNYVRHRVMPSLRQRWPAVSTQLSAAARHAAEAEALLQELLAPVLESCCAADGSLDCDALLATSTLQQRQLLRAWLARHCPQPLSEAQLQVALQEVVGARGDAEPELALGRLGSLRRYRRRLFWLLPQPALPPPQDWPDPSQPLRLGEHVLSLQCEFGRRLALPSGARLRVGFRQGGEQMQLRAGRRSLKKILQGGSLPPWQRERAPLLFVDGELAAVWPVCIAVNFDKSLKKQ